MNKTCGANFVLIVLDTYLLSLAFKADIAKQSIETDSPLGFVFIVTFVLCAFFCAVNADLNFFSWRGMLRYDAADKFIIRDILFSKEDIAACLTVKIFGWIFVVCTLVWLVFSVSSSLWYHAFASAVFIPILLIHMLAYISFMKAKGTKK